MPPPCPPRFLPLVREILDRVFDVFQVVAYHLHAVPALAVEPHGRNVAIGRIRDVVYKPYQARADLCGLFAGGITLAQGRAHCVHLDGRCLQHFAQLGRQKLAQRNQSYGHAIFW